MIKFKRNKEKGFTLIELLITICVLSLIMAIAFFTIIKITDKVKEKKNKININNVKEGASQYIKEFKTDSKYWIKEIKNEETSTYTEFACTTVGMLVNKGILKSNVLGAKVVIDTDDGNSVEKTIDSNTSIRINRNPETKVYDNNILFYDESCKSEISLVVLKLEKTNLPDGNNNWYKNNVEISVDVISGNEDNIDNYLYSAKIGNNSKTRINPLVNGNHIFVSENGKNIDVCAVAFDVFDNQSDEFCLTTNDLEGENSRYKKDSEKPSTPDLVLTTNGSYMITAGGSSDNFTSTSDLKYIYKIENLDNGSVGNGSESFVSFLSNSRSENGIVVTYETEDEAGNRSDPVSKTLTINNSENKLTENTKWYCSLDTSVDYESKDLAEKACGPQKGVVTEISSIYECSKDKVTYSDITTAKNNCKTEIKGDVTPNVIKYYCDINGKTYSSLEDATEKCVNISTEYLYEESKKYKCSLSDELFNDEVSASEKCESIVNEQPGTINYIYMCENNNFNYNVCSTGRWSYGLVTVTYNTGRNFLYYDGYNKYCGFVSSSSENCNIDVGGISINTFNSSSCNSSNDSGTESEWWRAFSGYNRGYENAYSWNYKQESNGKYYCSRQWFVNYYSYGITPDIFYGCSLTGEYYSDITTARNNCKKSYTIEEIDGYYCPITGDFSTYVHDLSDTCYKETETSGNIEEKINSYKCSLNGKSYTTLAKAEQECTSVEEEEINTIKQFKCDLYPDDIYTDYNDADNSCITTITGTTASRLNYYCSVNNKNYDVLNDETEKCKNHCPTGTYYESGCYIFN